MLPSILCLVSNHEQAEQIVERLQAANVPVGDISAMVLPSPGSERPVPIKGLGYADTGSTEEKTAAGAATGGVAGAAAGVATMGLVGLTPLLMIAPLIVATGAAVGAATTATAVATQSSLTDYGIAPSRMEYYQDKLTKGSYLIAVRTEDEEELGRAQTVFEQSGGQDIELFRLTKKLT